MATKIDIGPYVVGEKPAPLEYTFLDSAGVAVNLTGYTAKFIYRRTDDTSPVTANATVSTPAGGKVTYTWTGAEFATPGQWWAEFVVGNGTNRFMSLRLEYTVRAGVGPTPSI